LDKMRPCPAACEPASANALIGNEPSSSSAERYLCWARRERIKESGRGSKEKGHPTVQAWDGKREGRPVGRPWVLVPGWELVLEL
jgi:hypothetical protein